MPSIVETRSIINYLILYLIDYFNENNVNEVNGIDLNMAIIDYIHDHSSLKKLIPI